MNYDRWKLAYPPHYDVEVSPLDCQDKIGKTVEFWHSEGGFKKYIMGVVVAADFKTVTLRFLDFETTYELERLSE